MRHQLHRDLRREDGPAAPAAPVLRLRHRSGRVQDQRPPPALLRRVQLAQVVLQRHLHVGDAVPRGRRRRRLQMPRLRVRLRGRRLHRQLPALQRSRQLQVPLRRGQLQCIITIIIHSPFITTSLTPRIYDL